MVILISKKWQKIFCNKWTVIPRFSIFLLLIALASLAQALDNQLVKHVSPYLAMHGNDPVHWQDWNQDTLALAKKTGKPLFISSGYFSCHWCHVMQRESYQDKSVAEILNQYFIPVKVDRELEPALDEYLISFVQATRGSAGWPLNVFLTPDGYPLIGFTYLPKDNFFQLLEKLNEGWQLQKQTLVTNARKGAQELANQQVAEVGDIPKDKDLATAFIRQLQSVADELQGGFGNQNKFPMTPQLMASLTLVETYRIPALKEFLETTLDKMAEEGMRDHLAGGFFRYSVDPGWQIPHYEKMLYNQATLALVYLKAAKALSKPSYNEVAYDTLDFVINVFNGKEGGYLSSSSAVDGNGEEGGNYLWSEQQLRNLLSEQELLTVTAKWGLLQGVEEDLGYLPRLQSQNSPPEPALKKKLLASRDTRKLPLDTKQLAGWNGLMLSAFAKAANVSNNKRYIEAADSLYRYLLQQHVSNNQIMRLAKFQGDVGTASIEDYAYVSAGLYDWQRYKNMEKDRSLTKMLVETAFQKYFTGNGWVDGGASLLPLVPEKPILDDGAMASPSAVLLELADALGVDSTFVNQAKAKAAQAIVENPFWSSSHTIYYLQTNN